MREKVTNSTPTPAANAKVITMTREAGYRADGGKVDKIKSAIQGKRKRKSGGHVGGKTPAARLDKRARGGAANESEKVYKEPGRSETKQGSLKTTNIDSEAPGRARGGRRHGHGGVNVIVHAGGGSNPMEKEQAAKAGMQKGVQVGAMMGAKAAMGHGAPMGAPPPGVPPMGAAPPPMGAAMPPMGPGLGRKSGGKVETVKVREHVRRRAGGKVEGC